MILGKGEIHGLNVAVLVIYVGIQGCVTSTPPETNLAPKNGWLEYYFPIGEAYFHSREGNYFISKPSTSRQN